MAARRGGTVVRPGAGRTPVAAAVGGTGAVAVRTAGRGAGRAASGQAPAVQPAPAFEEAVRRDPANGVGLDLAAAGTAAADPVPIEPRTGTRVQAPSSPGRVGDRAVMPDSSVRVSADHALVVGRSAADDREGHGREGHDRGVDAQAGLVRTTPAPRDRTSAALGP